MVQSAELHHALPRKRRRLLELRAVGLDKCQWLHAAGSDCLWPGSWTRLSLTQFLCSTQLPALQWVDGWCGVVAAGMPASIVVFQL